MPLNNHTHCIIQCLCTLSRFTAVISLISVDHRYFTAHDKKNGAKYLLDLFSSSPRKLSHLCSSEQSRFLVKKSFTYFLPVIFFDNVLKNQQQFRQEFIIMSLFWKQDKYTLNMHSRHLPSIRVFLLHGGWRGVKWVH